MATRTWNRMSRAVWGLQLYSLVVPEAPVSSRLLWVLGCDLLFLIIMFHWIQSTLVLGFVASALVF